MDFTNEKELVEAIKNSNKYAFQYLLDEYLPRIITFLKKYFNLLYEDARDIVNDAIEDGFMKIESFDFKKGKLKSWLTRIAYNNAVNKHNRRISVKTTPLKFEPAQACSENCKEREQNENTQLKFQFHEMILKFSKKDQIILELLMKQYKMKEIAEIMQISYDNVRQSKGRIYKKIKKDLKSSSFFRKIYFREKDKEGE